MSDEVLVPMWLQDYIHDPSGYADGPEGAIKAMKDVKDRLVMKVAKKADHIREVQKDLDREASRLETLITLLG